MCSPKTGKKILTTGRIVVLSPLAAANGFVRIDPLTHRDSSLHTPKISTKLQLGHLTGALNKCGVD